MSKFNLSKTKWYLLPKSDKYYAKLLNDCAGGYLVNDLANALSLVKKFGRFIDIGAHVGLFTVPLTKLFDVGYAFEPCLYAMLALRKNTIMHGILPGRDVFYKQVALHTKAQKAMLERTVGNSGATTLSFEGTNKADVRDEVIWTGALNRYDYKQIDFVKISTNGSELEVLKGASRFLKNNNPILMVNTLKKRPQVIEYLRTFKFEAVKITDNFTTFERIRG